ncbi:MAG: hypothetical protein KF784_12410 [Fimbriimonadaceae bacterium]|nr:hypothetical protein [Fimbriimonadaceae bacterium]
MVQVLMVDESTAGGRIQGLTLQIASHEISIRDLIALRVRTEIENYNRERPARFYGLIQPTDVETFLNGPKERAYKPINADRQVQIALDAFEKQRFLVLLPGGQAQSLDEVVTLRDNDEVSFLRLVPLIGG